MFLATLLFTWPPAEEELNARRRSPVRDTGERAVATLMSASLSLSAMGTVLATRRTMCNTSTGSPMGARERVMDEEPLLPRRVAAILAADNAPGAARPPATVELLPGRCGACDPHLRRGGVARSSGSRFCNHCGTPGQPEAATLPDAAVPVHVSRVLHAEASRRARFLTAKGALEGERKHVTVLFADLKGSMELLADRDPEDARKILDPVLAHMMEAVHRYEGTVNQVMGDGIMALFGAPIAHEDHAVRACYAALRMQESVDRYADEARRAHGATVQIRVGLNSGEVVVGAIGNDLHMDYTAVGETTHLAARMEQAARPGTVLIAPATLAWSKGSSP